MGIIANYVSLVLSNVAPFGPTALRDRREFPTLFMKKSTLDSFQSQI